MTPIEKHMYIMQYWKFFIIVLMFLVFLFSTSVQILRAKRKAFSIMLISGTCVLTISLYLMSVYSAYVQRNSISNANPGQIEIVGTWKSCNRRQIIFYADGVVEICDNHSHTKGRWTIEERNIYEECNPIVVTQNNKHYKKYKLFSLFGSDCLCEYDSYCDIGFYEANYYKTDYSGNR